MLLAYLLGAVHVQVLLKTYINRIYFPFVIREPDMGNCNGFDWAVWLYSPYRSGSAGYSVRLGLALLLPSFDCLPETLNSIEDILYGSGTALWPSRAVRLGTCLTDGRSCELMSSAQSCWHTSFPLLDCWLFMQGQMAPADML